MTAGRRVPPGIAGPSASTRCSSSMRSARGPERRPPLEAGPLRRSKSRGVSPSRAPSLRVERMRRRRWACGSACFVGGIVVVVAIVVNREGELVEIKWAHHSGAHHDLIPRTAAMAEVIEGREWASESVERREQGAGAIDRRSTEGYEQACLAQQQRELRVAYTKLAARGARTHEDDEPAEGGIGDVRGRHLELPMASQRGACSDPITTPLPGNNPWRHHPAVQGPRGTGGGGGNGEHGGRGGDGVGTTFNANVVHVENMHGPSTISAGRTEPLRSWPQTHILPYFAPKALFDADAAAGGPARRACTDNTRVGLISRLKEWACNAQSSPIFWLSGMAGTGKSTVAYTLCQHWRAEGRLGASFFCSRNDEKARSRASIIPTIVQQLLPISKPFSHSVENAHIGIIIQASTRHVAELLVQPWLQAMASQVNLEEQPPWVVVIYALDEIEGNTQGPQLIKQLVEALSAPGMRLGRLKFFLTSRPHPGIVAECSSIEMTAIYRMEEITPEGAIEDVRRFVNAELPDLPGERREGIITNSAGLFIYAATISHYICPISDVKPTRIQQVKRLNRLGVNILGSEGTPELLIGSLYKAIISDVLCNVGQEVETSKRVLYAAVTTRRPLTVLDLAPLIFDADNEVDEMAVHNNLANAAMSYFRDRTHDCVRIMNKLLRFNVCNLPSSFLLNKDDKGLADRVETNISSKLRYACLHWAAHLALKVLFWMEAMHLLKSDCRLAIHRARTWAFQVQNAELDVYMAAIQRLWTSFFQGQASLSTPHLYNWP
ncbi:hypothetical protein B0H17DRAFT_1269394 [Mycena rosella]|uniref:Nephrocystin 3-like N-terminal domain-containing protein n=1 Tax=Mycena rosella TaxID=1033263 RepID=A0AAD7GML8_MYCRO|nr:hypothetical protein B0H17DRAFT_1269394 [Mycena rosella]